MNDELITDNEFQIDNENCPLILNYLYLAAVFGVAYFSFFHTVVWGHYYLMLLFSLAVVNPINDLFSNGLTFLAVVVTFIVDIAVKRPDKLGTALLIYLSVNILMVVAFIILNKMTTRYFYYKGITFNSSITRFVTKFIGISLRVYVAYLVISKAVVRLNQVNL